MPSTTKDDTASGSYVRLTINLPIENSLLKAASVIDLSGALAPNDFYAELGIKEGGTAHENKIAVLTSDYGGGSVPVSWTGSIIMEPEYLLYADIYSLTGGKMRLVGQMTGFIASPEGVLLIDP